MKKVLLKRKWVNKNVKEGIPITIEEKYPLMRCVLPWFITIVFLRYSNVLLGFVWISKQTSSSTIFLPVTFWQVIWLLMSQISFYSWKFFWKDSYSRFFWGCESKLCMGYAVEVLTIVSFFFLSFFRRERGGGVDPLAALTCLTKQVFSWSFFPLHKVADVYVKKIKITKPPGWKRS